MTVSRFTRMSRFRAAQASVEREGRPQTSDVKDVGPWGCLREAQGLPPAPTEHEWLNRMRRAAGLALVDEQQ